MLNLGSPSFSPFPWCTSVFVTSSHLVCHWLYRCSCKLTISMNKWVERLNCAPFFVSCGEFIVSVMFESYFYFCWTLIRPRAVHKHVNHVRRERRKKLCRPVGPWPTRRLLAPELERDLSSCMVKNTSLLRSALSVDKTYRCIFGIAYSILKSVSLNLIIR